MGDSSLAVVGVPDARHFAALQMISELFGVEKFPGVGHIPLLLDSKFSLSGAVLPKVLRRLMLDGVLRTTQLQQDPTVPSRVPWVPDVRTVPTQSRGRRAQETP